MWDRETAESSIYIDFEGFGRSSKTPMPHPHMLGAYQPKKPAKHSIFHTFCFKDEWQPISNGWSPNSEVCTLNKAIEKLLSFVQKEGGLLVYYSDHERAVIEKYCSASIYKKFVERSFNVKPALRRMFNRNRRANANGGNAPTTLNEFMEYHMPGHRQVNSVVGAKGPADACRSLDKVCTSGLKWRKWIPEDKALAKALFDYNKGDCISTWKLAKLLANHNTRFEN